MATLSSHVLDTGRGRPAEGVPVQLSTASGEVLGATATDERRPGGRAGRRTCRPARTGCASTPPPTSPPRARRAFYPEVVVAFSVGEEPHYHVPLLLSPFGYSTYRGS